jgi:preprotein translocase subunit SecA
MRGRIDDEVVRYLFWLRPVADQDVPAPVAVPARRATPLTMSHPAAEPVPAFAAARGTQPAGAAGTAGSPAPPRPARTGGDDVIKTVRREEPKVGRNDPCPCGSGKKYKKCHGAAA